MSQLFTKTHGNLRSGPNSCKCREDWLAVTSDHNNELSMLAQLDDQLGAEILTENGPQRVDVVGDDDQKEEVKDLGGQDRLMLDSGEREGGRKVRFGGSIVP
jgi:hypothetical protein